MKDCSMCDYATSTMGGRCCMDETDCSNFDTSEQPSCTYGDCETPVSAWGDFCAPCTNASVRDKGKKTYSEAEIHEMVLLALSKKDAELDQYKRELTIALQKQEQLVDQVERLKQWRELALQFDGQRMQAMSLLKTVADGSHDFYMIEKFITEAPVMGCRHLTELRAETIQSLQFPVTLRKMWSGSEVQEWLKEQADIVRKSGK